MCSCFGSGGADDRVTNGKCIVHAGINFHTSIVSLKSLLCLYPEQTSSIFMYNCDKYIDDIRGLFQIFLRVRSTCESCLSSEINFIFHVKTIEFSAQYIFFGF